MNKNLPIVAIVGQPNAGKSSLFNKIARTPAAVTSDLAGTTRDRQYLDTSWNGREFTLVDTAGLTLDPKDQLELSLSKQIEVAISQADAIIFVVDGKENRGSIAQATVQKFRKIKKPVIFCVNKLDSPKTREEKLENFKSVGLKPMFGTSATTGAGIGDMLDEMARRLPSGAAPEGSLLGTTIAVSIVGKPNVGKSSIFNKILDEERVVVSPIPGTTRTAIDHNIAIGSINYTFIDTAGLKKKEHRQAQPDIFSGFQTFKSIRRSDVCFFVLDASEEITKQDQRVANEILNMQKGCIILANKCDLVPSPLPARRSFNEGGARGDVASVADPFGNTQGRPELRRTGERQRGRTIGKPADDKYQSIRDYISHHFPFLWMCPLFFVSGLTGDGVSEAVEAIKPIFERRHKTITDEALKEFLNTVMEKNPPKLLRDQKKPKIFGLKQIAANPPMFELSVNHSGAISTQFRKFLENSIIKELDFYGTPIILKLRGKDKT